MVEGTRAEERREKKEGEQCQLHAMYCMYSTIRSGRLHSGPGAPSPPDFPTRRGLRAAIKRHQPSTASATSSPPPIPTIYLTTAAQSSTGQLAISCLHVCAFQPTSAHAPIVRQHQTELLGAPSSWSPSTAHSRPCSQLFAFPGPLPVMSFFGFDATLPKDRGHSTNAPGFAQPHDPFAAFSRGGQGDGEDDVYVAAAACPRAYSN
jgi:hypothetical protein